MIDPNAEIQTPTAAVTMNEPQVLKEGESTPVPTTRPPLSTDVPAHIIPAALPHPQISSPLARGVRYIHHFEILLISDGARLWDAASAEGKQVLADIEGEKSAQADTIAAAKAAPPAAAPPAGDPPLSGPSSEPANPAQQ